MKLVNDSPVVLGVIVLSVIVLLSGDVLGQYCLFNPYDVVSIGLVTNIIGHANMDHLFGNAMLLLLVGPSVEQRYGSFRLLSMMMITSVTICLLQYVTDPRVALHGASGIVFMCMLLTPFTRSAQSHDRLEVPLTLVLIALLYIGREIANGFHPDSTSQLAHIVGGLCGIIYGFIFQKNNGNYETNIKESR